MRSGGGERQGNSLMPFGPWDRANDAEMAAYPYDPVRASTLLEAVGSEIYRKGVRLRLMLKTSTDETTRLMMTAMQQQLREAGMEWGISIRGVGTFYAAVTKGAFQIYALRSIGSNEDLNISRNAFASEMMPPYGGNRRHYSNPRLRFERNCIRIIPDHLSR